MELSISGLNWLAVLFCVIVGQGFLTVWFLVLFGDPWARAYGAIDKTQHTKEIPGYTYAIGLGCIILLTFGLAILQNNLGISSLMAGVQFGVFMAVCVSIATALPGYAFLKRWPAFFLAIGSQTILIIILSAILAVWQ